MGKDYYIFSNGRIKRQDNTVYFINEELDKKALPIEQVDQIHIFGELDLNTKLLNYISQYGVCLHFYNYYGFYSGTYYSRKKNISGYINVNQSMNYFFEDKRLYLAKEFIRSAVYHILRLLRRHKDKVENHIENIELLEGHIGDVDNSVGQGVGAEHQRGKNDDFVFEDYPKLLLQVHLGRIGNHAGLIRPWDCA